MWTRTITIALLCHSLQAANLYAHDAVAPLVIRSYVPTNDSCQSAPAATDITTHATVWRTPSNRYLGVTTANHHLHGNPTTARRVCYQIEANGERMATTLVAIDLLKDLLVVSLDNFSGDALANEQIFVLAEHRSIDPPDRDAMLTIGGDQYLVTSASALRGANRLKPSFEAVNIGDITINNPADPSHSGRAVYIENNQFAGILSSDVIVQRLGEASQTTLRSPKLIDDVVIQSILPASHIVDYLQTVETNQASDLRLDLDSQLAREPASVIANLRFFEICSDRCTIGIKLSDRKNKSKYVDPVRAPISQELITYLNDQLTKQAILYANRVVCEGRDQFDISDLHEFLAYIERGCAPILRTKLAQPVKYSQRQLYDQLQSQNTRLNQHQQAMITAWLHLDQKTQMSVWRNLGDRERYFLLDSSTRVKLDGPQESFLWEKLAGPRFEVYRKNWASTPVHQRECLWLISSYWQRFLYAQSVQDHAVLEEIGGRYSVLMQEGIRDFIFGVDYRSRLCALDNAPWQLQAASQIPLQSTTATVDFKHKQPIRFFKVRTPKKCEKGLAVTLESRFQANLKYDNRPEFMFTRESQDQVESFMRLSAVILFEEIVSAIVQLSPPRPYDCPFELYTLSDLPNLPVPPNTSELYRDHATKVELPDGPLRLEFTDQHQQRDAKAFTDAIYNYRKTLIDVWVTTLRVAEATH